MIVKDKNILIVGMGRSGVSAAKLLSAEGAAVTAIDSKSESELQSSIKELRSAGIDIVTASNSLKHLDGRDMVVISPGVPFEHLMVIEARKRGIKVIGELEVAYQYCKIPLIAVTGTNGKSTTTSLIGHILKTAGINSHVAGNIGKPFSSIVGIHGDAAVIEVSSYQLETVEDFKPRVAVWMNLSVDHLGRHGDIESYAEVKSRIFQRQNSNDVFAFNQDDPVVRKYSTSAPGLRIPFSFNGDSGTFIRNSRIFIDWRGISGEICQLNQLQIRGRHNIENALAASAAAAAFGVDFEAISKGLKTFAGIEHRQEIFAVFNGIDFINDSKATNLDSTLMALDTFNPPLILIAGGQGKGESYAPARDMVKDKVRLLIALGEAAEPIISEFADVVDTMYARDFKSAVKLAWENAVPGDSVLLSPMCASFDMFRDFEERGNLFKLYIKELIDKEGTK